MSARRFATALNLFRHPLQARRAAMAKKRKAKAKKVVKKKVKKKK
jgi:hypothetical protein